MFHPANGNALEDSVSHEMPRLNSVETEVNPKRTQERHKDDTGSFLIFLLLKKLFG